MPDKTHHKLWQLNSVRTGPRGGVPVLLIHPVGLDLTYWGEQIAAISEEYDVIAFDLPGQGSSPGKPEDWTIPQAVTFVEQMVESSGRSEV